MEQTKRPWWKWALAAVGLCYLLGAAVWAAHAYVTRDTTPKGPSELAAHPERQAEILARRRAEEMRDQLGLTEEQTARLAVIFQQEAAPGEGDFRERAQAMRAKIMEVLTPEQREKLEQERGPMRGPGGPEGGPPPGMGAGGPGGMPPGGPPPGGMGMMGGPGGPPGARVTPERIESLKASMTPEQRERFEKSLQRMQERRGQGRGLGGQSGGPGGGQRPRGQRPQ